jgi:hypothetical protein
LNSTESRAATEQIGRSRLLRVQVKVRTLVGLGPKLEQRFCGGSGFNGAGDSGIDSWIWGERRFQPTALEKRIFLGRLELRLLNVELIEGLGLNWSIFNQPGC